MRCVYCRFHIPDDATVCGRCSRDLPPRPPEEVKPLSEKDIEELTNSLQRMKHWDNVGDWVINLIFFLMALPFVFLFIDVFL